MVVVGVVGMVVVVDVVGGVDTPMTAVDGLRVAFPKYEALVSNAAEAEEVQAPVPCSRVATHTSVAPVKKVTVPVGTLVFDATAA
jgi:hypothetical protein